MTKYLVFSHIHPNPDHWEPLAEVEATSSAGAIRKHIKNSEDIQRDGGGEFVAVPARSWQPVKVQVETALKFSS